MKIKRISLLFTFLSLLILSLYSQPNPYGIPWIQNYHFSEMGGSEQNWCVTQDFRGLIYVGNSDKGVLEYDGSSWRAIPVPGMSRLDPWSRERMDIYMQAWMEISADWNLTLQGICISRPCWIPPRRISTPISSSGIPIFRITKSISVAEKLFLYLIRPPRKSPLLKPLKIPFSHFLPTMSCTWATTYRDS